MTKHLSRREQRHQQDRTGYRLIGGCVAALVVGGGLVLANQPPARDATTGCLRTILAQHATAVVDLTDPFTPPDRALLRGAITGLADGLPADARLTLTPFSGAADLVPEPLFDRCRPAEGKDLSAVFATTARVDKAFAETFAAPVGTAIDRLTHAKGAPATNLVQFIATLAGGLGYRSQATRRRIRLYSNMAEHTPAGSFLGKKPFDGPGFTAYLDERVGTRLKGIELEIVVTPSAATPAGVAKRIKTVWAAALTANGVAFTWEHL